MDRDVEFVGCVENTAEFEPCVVVAAVIVNVFAVKESTFVDMLKKFFTYLFDHFYL